MERSNTPYGNHQFGIYSAGLKGELPTLPLRYEDLEARAREVLDPAAYWYVAGGAGEASMTANRRSLTSSIDWHPPHTQPPTHPPARQKTVAS